MTQPPPGPPEPQGQFGPPPRLPAPPEGFGPPQAGFGPPQAGFGPPVEPPPGGFGPPAPVGPPPPRARRRRVVVIASVAALALVAGGGAWYVAARGDGPDGGGGKGGGKKPGPAYAKPAEAVPADPKATFHGGAPVPKLPKKESTWPVKGSWLTDEVYVKSSVAKITGLDAATGETRWTLPKPGQSCGGSPEIGAGGIAVVVVAPTTHDAKGFRAPCTQVLAFRVATGEKLWTKTVRIGYQTEKTPFNQVAISGRTVAVGGLYGGAAFDLRTGEPRWKPRAGDTCRDVGYGGGARLVAIRTCGDYGAEKYEVQDLDPRSGKPRWRYKLPGGVRNLNVVSTDPVVVGLDSGEITAHGASDVFALDGRGRLRSRISLPERQYAHDCGDTAVVNDCRGLVVGNDRLYAPTARRDAKDGIASTNDIVVFSLATGKTTGQRGNTDSNGPTFPFRMDGGNVLAYRDQLGVQVVTLDGRTLRERKLLTSAKRPGGLVPVESELHFVDGRLYMSTDLAFTSGAKGPERFMMYVFARKDQKNRKG
ncbi:PQQ-binding-like beta-propeller repeat protein [Streptomyces sp. MNP-20]|uniref:outer membrane protein assembly factor BamB family protein n=1 Tax=Streptomyces sp. MNP-20 TaxID=2721165 RepID=UPI0015582EFA|nr:PQQ-binding-like beta-propeller repeat protein [Streptomyces sp. MNP-20]